MLETSAEMAGATSDEKMRTDAEVPSGVIKHGVENGPFTGEYRRFSYQKPYEYSGFSSQPCLIAGG